MSNHAYQGNWVRYARVLFPSIQQTAIFRVRDLSIRAGDPVVVPLYASQKTIAIVLDFYDYEAHLVPKAFHKLKKIKRKARRKDYRKLRRQQVKQNRYKEVDAWVDELEMYDAIFDD